MADVNPLLFYLANQNQGAGPLAPYLPQVGSGVMAPNLSPEDKQAILNMNLNAAITGQPVVTKAPVIAPKPGASPSLVKTPNQTITQVKMPVGNMDRQHQLEQELYDQVKNSLLEQHAGVSQLENMRNQIASVPTEVDLSPLNAYVDSIVKDSKLSANYKRPESGSEKQSKLFALQDAIQKAKQGMSQDEIAALKEQLNAGIYKQMISAQRQGMSGQRLDFQQEKEARATLNNDPLLKQYTPRLEGAAKALELVQAAKKGDVTANSALLGQLNAEVSRLETGSQSPGLQAGEKTELVDMYANLVSRLNAAGIGLVKNSDGTSSLAGSVNPANLDAIEKLVKELNGSYMRGIDSRFDFLKSGMNQLQQPIADDKYRSIVKGYSKRLGGWGDSAPAADPQRARLEELRAKAAAGGQ